jgi:hypothetical protein
LTLSFRRKPYSRLVTRRCSGGLSLAFSFCQEKHPSISIGISQLRFLLRLIGYALVGIAFVTGVLDGARSLANSDLGFTPLDRSLAELLGERYIALQTAISRDLSPGLWDYVLAPTVQLPTAVVSLILGVLVVLIGSWRRRTDRFSMA